MKKIIFRDPRGQKTVKLPSYEGAEVIIYDDILSADMIELEDMEGGTMQKGIRRLELQIKSWNLYADDETLLEVTRENLLKLPQPDLWELIQACIGKDKEDIQEEAEENNKKKD